MNTNQEKLLNVTNTMDNINNNKILKVVIHLENDTQEVIRREIDGNYDTWLGVIKPLLIAALCRTIQKLSLKKQAA